MSSHTLGVAVLVIALLLFTALMGFGWINRRPRSTRRTRYEGSHGPDRSRAAKLVQNDPSS